MNDEGEPRHKSRSPPSRSSPTHHASHGHYIYSSFATRSRSQQSVSVHLVQLCRPSVQEEVDKLTTSLMKVSTKSVLMKLKFFFLLRSASEIVSIFWPLFTAHIYFLNATFRAVVLVGTSESDLDHLTLDAKAGPFIKCKGKVHPGIGQKSP